MGEVFLLTFLFIGLVRQGDFSPMCHVKLRVVDNPEFLNDEVRVSRYSCTVRRYVAVLKRSDNESCRHQQRDHVRRRSCAAMAPQRSMQTSIGELVRLGNKLWWYSSKMAIKSVHDTARKAARRQMGRYFPRLRCNVRTQP